MLVNVGLATLKIGSIAMSEIKRFSGKNVLVTGGSSGIGLAIAQRFATEGASLTLVARDPDKGASAVDLIQELGADCTFLQADLSEETEIAQLTRKLGTLARCQSGFQLFDDRLLLALASRQQRIGNQYFFDRSDARKLGPLRRGEGQR